jgi:hypothetical protein
MQHATSFAFSALADDEGEGDGEAGKLMAKIVGVKHGS